MTRPWIRPLQPLALLALGVVSLGCVHVMATTPLSDGNVLNVEGRGSKASAELMCLSADAIEKLTGSKIDPHATPASCYTVVIVTSDSSSISAAVTAFVSAESEFKDDIAGITGTKGKPSVVADALAAIVHDFLTLNQSDATARATAVLDQMSPENRKALSDGLVEARATIPALPPL